MSYIITIDPANNKSISSSYVVEVPETLENNQYAIEEDAFDLEAPMRFIKDGASVRQMTEAEFEAEIAELTSVAAARDNRRMRDMKLAACDWVVTKALEAGEEVPADWATYRQALRDITTHANFPLLEEADWPVAP